jgi:hypothetical protein
VPFLLQGTLVYEVPIASGYFCLSAGYLFLFRTLAGAKPRDAAICGLFLGLAVGCRPHLGLAIIPAAIVLILRTRRSRRFPRPLARQCLIAFAMPVLACCLAVCAYNYARFGSPLEFGLKYQLGETVYNNITLSAGNLLPGLYYMLACAPYVEPVFPFFRLAIRPPFNSVHYALPARYFLEPTAGALYMCPMVLIALATPLLINVYREFPPIRSLLIAIYTYAIACITFIALTGLNSQRFEVDFLPYLLLAACLLAVEVLSGLSRIAGKVAGVAIFAAITYSAAINISIGMQGFVDEWLRNRPAQYVRVALWFSPFQRFRPALNPSLDVRAYFQFPDPVSKSPLYPLIGAGEFGSRYMLSAESEGAGRLALTSEEGANVQTAEVKLDSQHQGFNLAEIRFDPRGRLMLVYWNGDLVLRQRLDYLITAESQIRCGLDTTFMLKHRFPYRVVLVSKQMSEQPGT